MSTDVWITGTTIHPVNVAAQLGFTTDSLLCAAGMSIQVTGDHPGFALKLGLACFWIRLDVFFCCHPKEKEHG
jgi:hypothetical protein